MKNSDFSDELERDNNGLSVDRPVKQNQEIKTIGDIDELIFPDDEPYYISQR